MLQYVESFFKVISRHTTLTSASINHLKRFQNPIKKFDLPIRLDNWFDEKQTDEKRAQIKSIIQVLAEKQQQTYLKEST